MATIQSTLRLNDKMSGTFSAINKAMDSTLVALRTIKGVELGPEFAQAAADVHLAGLAISEMNSALQDTPAATRAAADAEQVLDRMADFIEDAAEASLVFA